VAKFAGASYTSQPTLSSTAAVGGLWVTGAGAVTLGGSSLTIAGITINGNASTGIEMDGSAGGLSITAPLVLSANQTWLNNSANSLSLSSAATINDGGDTLTISGSGSTAIASVISGAGSLIKTGSGLLILSGVSSFAGNTTVSGGTLQLNTGSGGSGELASPSILINSGGFLALNAGDVLGYTSAREAIVINSGGTVSNITSASRVTIQNTISMTGGVLTGTGIGDANGVYSLNTTSAVNATSDASGNPAQISAKSISLQGGTATFNVTRGALAPASDLIVSSALTPYGGNGSGISLTGNGIMSLTGTNTFTGAATISGGTLMLDFSAAGAPSSNILLSGDVVAFAGGNLSVKGLSGSSSSQTLGNPTFTGASSLTLVPNGSASLVVSMGTVWSRPNLGTLNLVMPSGGSLTSSPALTGGGTGILPYVTVAGTDFATVVGGNVVAVPSYNNDSYTPTDNTNVTAINPSQSSFTDNSLRFNTAQANTLTLSGTNVISSGGLLVTPNVGAHVTTISGGTLSGASGADLIVHQWNTGGSLTINSIITDNGSPTGLTKSGPGTLVLGSANTYSGSTSANAGLLVLDNASAVQNSTVNLTGGTLGLGDSATNITSFTFGGLAGNSNLALNTAFLPASAVALTFGGNNQSTVYSGVLSGSGSLLKLGTGVSTLSGTNTYTGLTTVAAGTLKLGSASAMGGTTSGTTINSGATLDLNGQNLSAINKAITVSGTGASGAGGAIINSNASSTSTPTAGWLENVTLTGNTTINASNEIAIGSLTGVNGTLNLAGYTLTKTGAGILALNGLTLSSAGNIVVNQGSLQIESDYNNNSGQQNTTLSSTGSITINSGASLITQRWAATINMTMPIVLNGGTITSTYPGPNGATIASPISLTANSTINLLSPGYNSYANAVFSGNISGSAGLSLGAANNLTLSGSNSYSGISQLTAGSIILGNSNALAGTTLNYGGFGGTLSFGALTSASMGGLSGSQSLALNNTSPAAVALSVGGNGNSTTYSGALSGLGSVTKVGSGVLELSGTNTYSGATNINAGVLYAAQPSSLSGYGTSGNVLVNSGTLEVPAGYVGTWGTAQVATLLSSSGATFAPGSMFEIDTSAASFTFPGSISGNLGLVKSPGYTLTLLGSQSYGGATNISSGSLQIGSGTLPGAISGSGTLVVIGPGALTLDGSTTSTNTGGTVINGGNLVLNFANLPSATNLLSSSSIVSMGGGTLGVSGNTFTPTSQTIAGLSLNSGFNSIAVTSSASTTLALNTISRVAGSGATVAFTLPASGSITTTNSNTNGILGGWAVISTGSNSMAWAANNGSNAIAASSTVSTSASTVTSTTNWAPTSTQYLAGNLTVNSLIETADLHLAGYTLNIGSGGIIFQGGNYWMQDSTGTLTSGAASGELFVHSANPSATDEEIKITIANNGTTPVSLIKDGPGNLILSQNPATYTGPTIVNGGTLQLNTANGSTGELGGTPSITVNSGAQLSLNVADPIGYTNGKEALVINGGTVSNTTAAGRATLQNAVTMTGGLLTGTGTGDGYGVYSINTTSGFIATSDIYGNAATIAAKTISLQGGTTTFNVTRGPASPASDLTVSSAIVNYGSNSAYGITQTGNGILTLIGSNTYTGPTTISGGTMLLNFAAAGAPSSNIINNVSDSSSLTLGGNKSSSELIIQASTLGSSTQQFNGLNVGSGGSTLQLIGNTGGAITASVGAITATAAGGSLLIDASQAVGGIVTSSSAADATGIYGGRIVYYDGTNYNWATTNSSVAPYTLSGYTGYTTLPASGASSTVNYSLAGAGTVTSPETVNTLKITPTAASQSLAISSGTLLTVNAGGLLFTGANNYTISGGSITAGNSGTGAYDLIVQQYAPANNLTISSVITNSTSAVSLVKAGLGYATLSGANTFTGTTYVNGGTLEVQNGYNTPTINVAAGATMKQGYTTNAYYGAGLITLNGIGLNAPPALQIQGGTTLVIHDGTGALTVQSAPTSITSYGTGIATINFGFAYNSTIHTTAAASGSVIASGVNISIQNVYGPGSGSDPVIQTDAGTSTATGDLTINGLITGGNGYQGTLTGFDKTGNGSLKLTAANNYGYNSSSGTSSTYLENGSIILSGGNNRLPSATTVTFGTGSTSAQLILGDVNGPVNQTLAGILTSGTGTANAIVGGNASVGVLVISNTSADTYSGILGGTAGYQNNLSLTVSGNTTLTLTNSANSYTGGTNLAAGVLSFAASSLGSSGTVAFVSPATLQWYGSNTQDISTGNRLLINDGVAATLDTNGNTVTLGTPIQTGTAATGSLTKVGAGTLVLAASNTYGGGTTISVGTLQAGNYSALGTGVATIASSATLDVHGYNLGVSSLGGPGVVDNLLGSGTLSLGVNNVTSTFSGFIQNTVGTLSLVKTGSGSATLTSNNTYAGPTTINSGSLIIMGSPTGTSPYTVNAGGTLSGLGLVSAPVNVLAGGAVAPGVVASGAAGTGTFTLASLNLANSADTIFNLSGTTSSGNSIIAVSGALSLTGTTLVTVDLLSPALGSGNSYPLFTFGSLSGTPSAELMLAPGAITSRQTSSFTTVGNTVYLNVFGSVQNLLWSGSSGGSWNNNTSNYAWVNSQGNADIFVTADNVNFTNSGSVTSVSITDLVSPSSVTITGSNSYSFSGSGSIAGLTSVVINNTGVTTFGTSNSYLGGTIVQSGTLVQALAKGLPAGGSLTLGSSGSSVVVDLGGFSTQLSSLATGSGAIAANQVIGSSSTTNSATLAVNATGLDVFGGIVKNTLGSGNQTLALSVGSGTLELTGSNSFTGPTTIAAGAGLQIGGGSLGAAIASSSIADSGSLTFNQGESIASYAGPISGIGSLT
jgi:autotransporter-associated beta strand protein